MQKNHLLSIFQKENVIVNLGVKNKNELFDEVGLILNAKLGLEKEDIVNSLLEREALGSTSLGYGVAIPHGRISGLRNSFSLVILLENAIEFDSPDKSLVKLFIILLVPESATQKHLEILSEIAQILSDVHTREKMLSADSKENLFKLLVDWSNFIEE